MNSRFLRTLSQSWFLIALFLVLAAGFQAPWLIDPLSAVPYLSDLLVASVLLITALPHPLRDLTQAMRRPAAVGLAVMINSLIIPLAAWPVSLGLQRDLGVGLIVAAAVPSTLASAAVWTRRAGGNDLIPILVTIITNLTCFLVTPFWIWLCAARNADLPVARMVWKLLLLVVLPLVVAQLARRQATIRDFADRHRSVLAVLAQLGILAMVALGARECQRHLVTSPADSVFSDSALSLVALSGMIAACLGLHLGALFLGWELARICGLSRSDAIGVGFAGSQKTLLVGLHVALSLGGGAAILPMVAYHVLQLIADTFVAHRSARHRGD